MTLPAKATGPWDNPVLATFREWELAVDQCLKMSTDRGRACRGTSSGSAWR
jgi:hypothetical protein